MDETIILFLFLPALKSKDMRSKHFGGVPDFTSIAGHFMSDLSGTTTICGGRISDHRVCIKVCHLQSHRSIAD